MEKDHYAIGGGNPHMYYILYQGILNGNVSVFKKSRINKNNLKYKVANVVTLRKKYYLFAHDQHRLLINDLNHNFLNIIFTVQWCAVVPK